MADDQVSVCKIESMTFLKEHIFTEIHYCQSDAVSPCLVSDLYVFLI